MPEDKGLAMLDEKPANCQMNDADWNEAVRQQGDILHRLIRTETGREKVRLLDCSGGSGAWAIGLARCGHAVTAAGMSPAVTERVRREAATAGVAIASGAADVRSLVITVPGCFDVVLAGDSSLSHLLTDADQWLAAKNMWQKLETDGLLLISHRDYERRCSAQLRTQAPHGGDGEKQIVFQHRDWLERENIHTVNDFVIRAKDGHWETEHSAALYRALSREEMAAVLSGAGFAAVKWHDPAVTGYKQPIMTARKRIRGEP